MQISCKYKKFDVEGQFAFLKILFIYFYSKKRLLKKILKKKIFKKNRFPSTVPQK